MDLVEWTERFIEYRDSFKGEISDKTVSGKEITCRLKEGSSHIYVVMDELQKEIFEKISSGRITVVCLNRKSNLKFLIEYWDKFIKNSKLKVLFANPNTNQQWSIIPYTHNLISDPDSLKLGLKSMFESLPEA
ncbi:hypothetical protein JXC34_02875 [Candidatus Woesearchaeota archaeon]|nr:hypothetical protein [Candidatus Woesearchaeota archaeon]